MGRDSTVAAALPRIGGLALLAAIPFAVVGLAIHPRGHPVELLASGQMVASHALLLCMWLLDLVGLLGLLLRVSDRGHTVRVIGLTLAFAGILHQVAYMTFFTFTVPILVASPAAHDLLAPGAPLEGGPFPGFLGLLAFVVAVLGVGLFGLRVVQPQAGWPGWIIPGGFLLVMVASRYATATLPVAFTDARLPLGTLYVPGAVAVQAGLAFLGRRLLRPQVEGVHAG